MDCHGLKPLAMVLIQRFHNEMGAQMLRMFKIFLAFLVLGSRGLSIASTLCSDIYGEDVHTPLIVAYSANSETDAS
jgi:hypothetical protein